MRAPRAVHDGRRRGVVIPTARKAVLSVALAAGAAACCVGYAAHSDPAEDPTARFWYRNGIVGCFAAVAAVWFLKVPSHRPVHKRRRG
jgi:predicted benzoate:H+ symporter BenE